MGETRLKCTETELVWGKFFRLSEWEVAPEDSVHINPRQKKPPSPFQEHLNTGYMVENVSYLFFLFVWNHASWSLSEFLLVRNAPAVA